jgi:hypothetical protein
LNLDAAQNRETDNNLRRSNETVDARIKEAYCWLLVPRIDKGVDLKTIVLDPIRISGGTDDIITKAKNKMIKDETIITKWAPNMLLKQLDDVLWKDSDHIAIKNLWEYLCTYCYLPRLADVKVLDTAIQEGLQSDHFAFASDFDGTRYIDLILNKVVGKIEYSGYLVKVSVAQRQIADDLAKRQAEATTRPEATGETIPASGNLGGDESTSTTSPTHSPSGPNTRPQGPREDHPAPATPKNRRFFMSADLNTTRIIRDVQKFNDEIIKHLISDDNAKVRVSLEVEAETNEGFTQETVRTISENCRTLRVRISGFEE